MKDKVEKIIESKGLNKSRGYHYSLMYQVKPAPITFFSPDIDAASVDPVLGLLVKDGMITTQTKVYKRGADEDDFDVIRIYVVGQKDFELTREEFDNLMNSMN